MRKKYDLPSLNALRAFEASARYLNFKSAANELCVTSGAISQQVRALERSIKVPLLLRQPGNRLLTLTRAGDMLQSTLEKAFFSIETTARAISPESTAKVLRLGVPTSFAVKWLFPNLPKFMKEHPAFDVQLSSCFSHDDLSSHHVDMIISYGLRHFPGFDIIRLFDETLLPVCNPKLLDDSPATSLVEILTLNTLLHDEYRQEWPMWLAAHNVEGPDPSRGPSFADEGLAVQAAIEGFGIALAGVKICEQDVARGRLKVLCPAYIAGNGYFSICNESDKDREDIVTFRRWLTLELGQRPDFVGTGNSGHGHFKVGGPAIPNEEALKAYVNGMF